MANIRALGDSAEKWARRASSASGEYKKGVEAPRRKWSDAAVAAEGNYKAGVTAAANAGRFGKGIKAVGESKWQSNAIAKGPGRFAEGVSLARPNYEAGFAPYHDAIKNLKLPPRGPKGSPQNINRVAAVAKTLRDISQRGGV